MDNPPTATAKKQPAKRKPKTEPKSQTSLDSGLLELVSEMRSELASLREEVSELRAGSVQDGLSPAETDALLEAAASLSEPESSEPGEPEPTLVVDPQGEEPGVAPEAVAFDDPNAAMSAEEIAAMFEQPVSEPELDPNAAMSAEEIAAMFEQPVQEPEQDPNAAMSAEEIAAMFEQPVPEPEQDPNAAMSAEEIAAMFEQPAPQASQFASEPTTGGADAAQMDTQIVSADEIKAMLGLSDPEDSTTGEPSNTEPQEITPEELMAIEPVKPEAVALEPVAEQPAVEVDLNTIDEAAVALVPGHLAAAALAFPVLIVDGALHCLSVEPFDQEALAALGAETKLSVVPHAAPIERVLTEIRSRYIHEDDDYVFALRDERPPNFLTKIFRRSA